MTILPSNLRLLESERMTDTSDGGGRRTTRVIPDGVAGNVFPKVSRVDAVYGRVNLRKVYPHVNTANLDVYAGAHFIITDAPDNGRIHVVAFSTGSDYDTRTSARDRIESYVIAGPESRMTLYGRQLQNSKAILAYQREEEPLPEVGSVFAISSETGGVVTAQQFVRVEDVAHEVRTFTDEVNGGMGEFRRRVVTLRIGSPLRYEFQGLAAPSRFSAAGAGATGRIRTTTVADAARYYGIQPLAAAAAAGDLTLSLASVFTPIVPTTQREAAVGLAAVTGALAGVACAAAAISDPAFPPVALGAFSIRLLRPPKPGSLALTNSLGVSKDNGSGAIALNSGTHGYTGTVDYETGICQLTPNYSGTLAVTPSYVPQAYVSQAAHTDSVPITLATRGTVYTRTLLPVPAAGTTVYSYRSMGRWYTLRDRGDGVLSGGDSAYGTGTVDLVTGALTVTLGALPDVGSSNIIAWGSPVHYEVHTADAGSSAYQDVQLAHFPVKPGALSFVYSSNGTNYTVTANSAGVLSGGGVTGSLNNTTGLMRVEYGTRLPDFDSSLSVSYTQAEIDPSQPGIPSGATLTTTASIAAAGGATVVTGVAAAAGSVSMLLACTHIQLGAISVAVSVAADGSATTQDHVQEAGGFRLKIDAGQAVGSFNHATGVLTIAGGLSLNVKRWTWGHYYDAAHPGYWYYETVSGAVSLAATGTHAVTYMRTLLTIDTARTETLSVAAAAPVRVDLTRTSTAAVVPDSVMFSASGKKYIDRNGTLFCDVSQSTGSGTQAGSIDYATGVCTLTQWVKGATLSLSVQSCLVRFGSWTATDAFFRTSGSPIRPASLYVQVSAEDGELLTGTADTNGNITGASMVGKVEQTMGVAGVSFGAMVTAAGNELQPWYNPANVVGGMVWKPRAVLPSTLRHSEVVLSNLPLNADILGLDPVRLPSDGRVPVVRPADVVEIHNTQSYNAGTPAAESVINVGRTGLTALWLEDSNKLKLSDALYTVNLAAGTATMAVGASLAGYVTPIYAKHRIGEMALLTDVQINGQITLAAPLLNSYPQAGSFVSTALLYGDLQARVTNLFDQQTWTGIWKSTVDGSGATAQYNDVGYPVEVLNNATVTERWRLNFTSATAFQVIGENLGVIATGTTSADLSPVNPLTGLAYFTLRAAGWGSGWATGNQLRFDTIAAAPPTWLARCVLPGAALTGDSFDAQLRGDVD